LLTVVVGVVCVGVAHGAFNNDIEALLGIRELVNYLPLSNREHAPLRKCDDPWSVLLQLVALNVALGLKTHGSCGPTVLYYSVLFLICVA